MKINVINAVNTLIQCQASQTGSVFTLGSIPYDDTIPQQTEGTEILTVTITPLYANSLLIIKANVFASVNSSVSPYANPITYAIFQDGVANALSASCFNIDWSNTGNITHVMTAGTTSATTFKLRVGSYGAQTCYVNADWAGTQFFNGVANTSLIVYEYSV